MAAKIQFADLPAISWFPAVTPRQDPRKLKEGQIYGFPVDAGSASFLSSEAAELHARKLMPTWGEVDFDYIRQLSSQMETHLEQGSWAIIEWPENKNLNAALFTSGFGDGFYASYWGYGKNGEIVALVIYFGLLDSAHD